ncbi:hypothetical protein ACJIZ3_012239 [Penstemon smallii]|uniref:Nuclear pore complex protein NUP214 n=1 Tax=Penstemon smallii TaxID=265156 RepID=A0ABD3UQ16_9LAMI
MAAEDGGVLIELDEEIDGDEIGSRNYRFSKVGESVPLGKSEFDPNCLPAQPLAVSERFRLLFVAHPQGFYVAKTEALRVSAEDIKEKGAGQSVAELSLVDVHLGNVSILAVSSDDSFLAATVDSHVHFFAVSALLHKEQSPSYSVSLDDSSSIKDMIWSRKDAKAYLVLADDGKLYSGSGQGPPSCVMESVDSVDWSVKGNFVAVAKKNTLSILSLQFKEKLSFLLPFQSVIGDSDVNQVIKVDSIRWLRSDCIAVGCFQLDDDGKVENYLVQVITSRDGKITDAASKPIVLSFNNVFMDFCTDAVPARSGRHLFISYLSILGLAFMANRNMSQHVGLFCWSLDNGKNEAAMVEILNDAWTLHIDSQDNGEDNVLLGLSVDKVSQNKNAKLTLGDEETEVSPCCVVICLTIDGKVSVFHFASAVGTFVSPEGAACDEEDNVTQVPVKHEPSQISSGDDKVSREQTTPKAESHELSRIEIGKAGSKATFTNNLSPFQVDARPKEQTGTSNLGPKPVINSQSLIVNEPTKSIFMTPTQDTNAEKSISEVKSTKDFFSGKVTGDVSSQSMDNYPLSGRNVDPLGKVPSNNSPSSWSLTWSHGKVDASKTSAGTFMSVPSNETDNLGKHALQSVGGPLRDPTDLKDKAKTSFSSVGQIASLAQGNRHSPLSHPVLQEPSQNRMVPSHEIDNLGKRALQSVGGLLRDSADLKDKARSSFTSTGQMSPTAQGNRHSIPSHHVQQMPLEGPVTSGNTSKSEFKKGSVAASSLTGLPYSAQNALKQFGNVEEMVKNLDLLLEDIEGKGGFKDASITSLEKIVKELEDGVRTLSNRCRMWRYSVGGLLWDLIWWSALTFVKSDFWVRYQGSLDEQLREVQLLLDKTVQVLVRKVYMEGIFKQATDSRYLELWNRQKLSSELEMKRRRILESNQELTNQLIELERHFNSLEFNKFGENGGIQRNRRILPSLHGHSRQIQSVYSLHNTMNAQLAAAEQLSGCLSKQMAVLSIEPSGKQDVKKQLFESIGLSYNGDSQRSSGRDRTFSTPNKEQLITSSSFATKEQSRRNQVSFAKICEPETARRRRDSLDRSWASFETPKTTVKRVLLKEDNEKGSANRSSLNIDRQYLTPQSQKRSEVAHSALPNPSGVLNRYKSKVIDVPSEKSIEGPSPSLFQKADGFMDRGIQGSSTLGFSTLPPPSLLGRTVTQSGEFGAFRPTDETLRSTLPFTGVNDNFAGSESKVVLQSDTSLTPHSYSTESLGRSKLGFSKSITGDKKNAQILTESAVFESKIPMTSASAYSSPLNASEKGIFELSEKPSQPHDGVSSSTQSQSVIGSSSFSSNFSSVVSAPSTPTLFHASPSSSEASIAPNQELSQSHKLVPSTLKFPSTLSSSTPESNLSSISPSSTFVRSESPSLSYPHVTIDDSKAVGIFETQTSVANMPSTTEKDVKIEASASQSRLAISTSDSSLGLSASSNFLTNSKFGTEIDLSNSSKSPSIETSVIKSEQPSAAEALSPNALSSKGIVDNVKNVVSDASPEEEMEEEASESYQTTEFSLGNLGGFGIGSTPNSTITRPNPFGVAVLNKDTTSAPSPFTMSPPSGELFRPASFNIQSQPPEPSQPTTAVPFSGGFSTSNPNHVTAASGFGQPAHMGAGQQALGSVLGTFGQSRQLGAGLGGSNIASANAFGGGFTGISAGGFGGRSTSSAAVGGFASLAASGGGFAGAGMSGGGFAAAAGAGGGFAAAAGSGGGFAVAAGAGGGFSTSSGAAASGGGFGAFSNQQGGGAFSSFGGGSGAVRPPSELFTQMRR